MQTDRNMVLNLSIQPAPKDQYNALHGIMALAGEHMHRVLKLSHWHPFPDSAWFVKHAEGRNVYAVYKDELLAGTFMLSNIPEPYYKNMDKFWKEPAASAMYFSAFALLPPLQQQGIGSWVMGEVDKLVQAQKIRFVRFDCVSFHTKLVHFYSRLGYEQRGILLFSNHSVMCFEKEYVFDK
jgi:GNAT superfamily N-acetyltransferase